MTISNTWMTCLSSSSSSTLFSLVILSIHECDSSSFILGNIHPKDSYTHSSTLPISYLPVCFVIGAAVYVTTARKVTPIPHSTLIYPCYIHTFIHACVASPSIPHEIHYPCFYSSTRRLSLSRDGSVTLVATVLQGV
jgi:hypothetical protein